jgi:probable rRNA maturation factor
VTLTLQQPKKLTALGLSSLYETLFQRIIDTLNLPSQLHLDVWITSNATIKRYNQQYRHIDKATDVLSFPQFEVLPSVKGKVPLPLGQLIISYEKAAYQAKAYGHSPIREFSFLFVHGVLHCLGYHHEDPAAEAIMLKLQDHILGKRVNS